MTKEFALAPDEDPRLELEWRGLLYRDLTLKLDGQKLGRKITDRRQLRNGVNFALPDHSNLRVQLVSTFFVPELRITRNGKPLPGSTTDPRTLHRVAIAVLVAIALMQILVGFVFVLAGKPQWLSAYGIGSWNFPLGLVYGGLTAFVAAKESRPALNAATALFALESVATIVLIVVSGGNPLAMLAFRALLFAFLVRGVLARNGR